MIFSIWKDSELAEGIFFFSKRSLLARGIDLNLCKMNRGWRKAWFVAVKCEVGSQWFLSWTALWFMTSARQLYSLYFSTWCQILNHNSLKTYSALGTMLWALFTLSLMHRATCSFSVLSVLLSGNVIIRGMESVMPKHSWLHTQPPWFKSRFVWLLSPGILYYLRGTRQVVWIQGWEKED